MSTSEKKLTERDKKILLLLKSKRNVKNFLDKEKKILNKLLKEQNNENRKHAEKSIMNLIQKYTEQFNNIEKKINKLISNKRSCESGGGSAGGQCNKSYEVDDREYPLFSVSRKIDYSGNNKKFKVISSNGMLKLDIEQIKPRHSLLELFMKKKLNRQPNTSLLCVSPNTSETPPNTSETHLKKTKETDENIISRILMGHQPNNKEVLGEYKILEKELLQININSNMNLLREISKNQQTTKTRIESINIALQNESHNKNLTNLREEKLILESIKIQRKQYFNSIFIRLTNKKKELEILKNLP